MKKIITIAFSIAVCLLVLIRFTHPLKEVVVEEYIKRLCACDNIWDEDRCDCAGGHPAYLARKMKDAEWCSGAIREIEEPYWENDGKASWEEKEIIKCVFLRTKKL